MVKHTASQQATQTQTISSDSWSLLYQAQLSRYTTIIENDHNMDAKGGIMFGALIAVTVFVVDDNLLSIGNKWPLELLVLGGICYLFSLLYILKALRPTEYPLPANSTADQPQYLTMYDADLMYQLIVDAEYATNTSEELLREKSRKFWYASLLFLAGSFCLIIVKLCIG